MRFASGPQHAGAGLHHRVRGLVGQADELGVFGFALDVRQDGALVPGADDGVGLPIADAAFGRDDGGSPIDVDAVGDQAAPRIPALSLVVFLAAVTQVQIQVTPVFLVVPDMPVDALMTDGRNAFLGQAAADLFGAPLLLGQLLLDHRHDLRRHLARRTGGGVAPARRRLVCLAKAVAARTAVAGQLAADCRWINADLARDMGLRMTAFQQRENLAALFAGQVEIAFGHGILREMWCPTRR